MKKKLTAVGIPSLPEGNYTDASCAGLNLRVGATRRTWSVFYRLGGKLKQTTIGYWPVMSLADARKAAGELAQRIDAGVSAEAPPPHPRKGGKTLAEVIDLYEAMRRSKAGKGVKTIDASLRTVRNNLGDHLKLPAKQFSKADLRGIRDAIHRRAPQQASRFLAYLGPVMRWAAQEDHVDTNFVPDVLKIAGIQKRERTLSHAEIAALWHASFKLDKGGASQRFGAMVRFLLLTAQRRGEAAALKHGHVLDNVWRQQHNKSDRPHRLKLPKLAIDQIVAGEAHEYCFAGKGGKQMAGFSKLKVDLDRLSGVAGWVLHDLRRTAASGMQELGVDHMTIEAVLNHVVVGVGAHYMHATLDKAKSDALQLWSAEVERIVGGNKRAAL